MSRRNPWTVCLVGCVIALVLVPAAVFAGKAPRAEPTQFDKQKELVLWLTFDDVEGKRVPDHSGRNNNGTIKGTVQTEQGKSGKAIHTGNDGYVELPDTDSLNITGKTITVMAWVYPRDEMGFSDFLTKGDNPQTATVLQIKEDNSAVNFYAGGWANSEATAWLTSRDLDRKWHHIAGVRDGHSLKLYLDGELISNASTSGEIGENDDPWNVGRNASHPYDRPTNGLIDDVRIYVQPLSQQEIREVMKRSSSTKDGQSTQ